MDMRADVWSPLQNSAVWLGAWLHGHEPADELIDALTQLGGYPEAYGSAAFSDILARLRAATDALLGQGPGEPVLRLVLSGPGEPPALPAGTTSAAAASASPAGAIVVRTADPSVHLVLVPHAGPNYTQWQLIEETQPLPAPAWLSPGEADALLAQATEESARIIEGLDYVTKDVPNPRLTVGALSDFYDTPGLPDATPPRAARLFARADRVAAIIETVTDRLQEHSLDPQLLRLWRHIRHARMAGVAYAVADFGR
ncbi:hypothetical protein [Corynebacterium sp. SA-MJD20WY100]|uniref:hypothetical protein n=1 Tax=Corynebacterium sp. SA-MJD20WY100 TaxID=3142969 RepID=UPI003221E829